jgi:peptidoglycan/LPS O-acetylase OafA/YrhL
MMTQPPPVVATRPTRVPAVDGLRGVLALVVMAWHVCTPWGPHWLLVTAKVAVALFFVLSGYVLTRAWDGRFGLFLIRRFVRLWPVYAVCLGAGYLIAGAPPVWSEVIFYPLITAGDRPAIDPPVWSLFLEVWAMPLMPLIVWAGRSAARAAPVMLVLIVISLGAGPPFYLALLIAGALVARSDYRSTLLEGAIPQWLGRISYSLYLSHVLVLTLAVRAFGPWGGVMAAPLTLAVGWMVWWSVDRPAIAASRRIGRIVGDLLRASPRLPASAAH